MFDLSPSLKRQGCESTGFFKIRAHQHDSRLLHRLLEASRGLDLLPREYTVMQLLLREEHVETDDLTTAIAAARGGAITTDRKLYLPGGTSLIQLLCSNAGCLGLAENQVLNPDGTMQKVESRCDLTHCIYMGPIEDSMLYTPELFQYNPTLKISEPAGSIFGDSAEITVKASTDVLNKIFGCDPYEAYIKLRSGSIAIDNMLSRLSHTRRLHLRAKRGLKILEIPHLLNVTPARSGSSMEQSQSPTTELPTAISAGHSSVPGITRASPETIEAGAVTAKSSKLEKKRKASSSHPFIDFSASEDGGGITSSDDPYDSGSDSPGSLKAFIVEDSDHSDVVSSSERGGIEDPHFPVVNPAIAIPQSEVREKQDSSSPKQVSQNGDAAATTENLEGFQTPPQSPVHPPQTGRKSKQDLVADWITRFVETYYSVTAALPARLLPYV